MTAPRQDITPITHRPLTSPQDLRLRIAEINKIKPESSISFEGFTSTHRAKITRWHADRKYFSVTFESALGKDIQKKIDHQIGLRTFFRVKLISTQLIFKATVVRIINANTLELRVPDTLYHQQRRGALRIPLKSNHAVFSSELGLFKVLDLSTTGLRVEHLSGKKEIFVGRELFQTQLKLKKESVFIMDAKISNVTSTGFGIRFIGLAQAEKVRLKQILIEALQELFKAPNS